jgi:hypothetical protein
MNETTAQLVISMKAFLFFEAYAPSDLDTKKPIGKIKIGGEALDTTLISIALKKWEIHHGYELNNSPWKDKSVQELVRTARKLTDEEYQSNVSQQMEEISALLCQYIEQSNSEHGVQEKAEYLLNLN